MDMFTQADSTEKFTSGQIDNNGNPRQVFKPASHPSTVTDAKQTTQNQQRRKRQIQMDSQQCLTHSQTDHGALPLTNPSMVKISSKDANRGLYPKQLKFGSVSHQGQEPSHSKGTHSAADDLSKSYICQGRSAHQYAHSKSLQTHKVDHFTQTSSSISPRKKRLPKEIPNQSQLSDFFKGNCESDNQEGARCEHKKEVQHAYAKLNLTESRMISPFPMSALPFSKNTYPKEKNENQIFSPKSKEVENKTKPLSFKAKPHSRFQRYAQPKQREIPSTMSSLLEDFDCDTGLDSVDVERLVSKAESDTSSPCKSSQGSSTSATHYATLSDDLLKDFENDTAFDCDEILHIVEKAESDTSSPCKSYRGLHNTFGLLGDTVDLSDSDDGSELKIDLFSKLPTEVMENIFCRLPILDLCLNVNLVCKTWNEIFNREKFLCWKKRYHKYKLQVDTTCSELNIMINKYKMTCPESFLLHHIKFLHNFRNWIGSSMLDDLKHHYNYEFAKDLIEERAPELIRDGNASPWCVIAVLAILSQTVADVTLIIRCLLNPMATCTAVDVIECLYCVATFSLILQRKHNTNRGLHYRIFYALYLFENSLSDVITKSSLAEEQLNPDQQSPWKYGHRTGGVCLTHEQLRIVSYEPEPSEVVKIVAFAGSGKTTTLIRYAQRRPNMKFLYVAFNRAVKEHAQSVFPENVTSKTTHSLAYGYVGFRYKNQITSSLMPKYVHELLPAEDKTNKTKLHWITRAKLVIDTLKAFMNSKEDFITTLHVPTSMVDKKEGGQRIAIPHNVQMKLAGDATLVWEQLVNVRNFSARITHDVYLKLYQLSKPWIVGYDCILIDEAQDLTPAQQDILLRQTCAKILVGDPNQQIYSFRGAQNAMDEVRRYVGQEQVIKTFHLTQSFRFGPEIAYVANLMLEFFKKNTVQNIVGKAEPGGILGEEVGIVAIICRTNVELFDQAVRICDEAKNKKLQTRIGFAGGVQGYGLDMLLDIYLLYLPAEQRNKESHKIQNKFLQGFKSFCDLKVYAINAMDGELEGKIKIVQKYNLRIPSIIGDVKARSTRVEYADIILSTAHKSKGLEFDTVKLTEDYTALQAFLLMANGDMAVRIAPDELNLVYVAVTRAKKRLVLNYSLLKFLEYTQECFEYPVSTKALLAKLDEVPQCLACNKLIEYYSNTMMTRRPKLELCFIGLSAHVPPNNGYLCSNCSAKQCKWFQAFCGGQEPSASSESVMEY